MSEHTLRRLSDLERRTEHDRVQSGTSAVIAARAATGSGQSIPNATYTIVNYGTVTFDTHGRISVGTSWIFTALLPGYYQVSAAILFTLTTNWAAGEIGQLTLFKNGAVASHLDRKDNFSGGVSQYMMLHGSDTTYLGNGETINVRAYQDSGAALALIENAEFNYVSIVRL